MPDLTLFCLLLSFQCLLLGKLTLQDEARPRGAGGCSLYGLVSWGRGDGGERGEQ